MDIVKAAEKLFLEEQKKTGMPVKEALDIALKKGAKWADKLGADRTIVQVGIYLMDLKVGQAWKENKVDQHIQMSLDAARDFLEGINEESKEKIINCIEAHHQAVPYKCLEAEICSNADSFQFLNPRGFLLILSQLIKQGLPLDKCLEILESKLEEKFKKVSLGICKKEAERYYKFLCELIDST